MKKRGWIAWCSIAVVAAGCQGGGALAKLNEQQAQMNEKQEAMMAELSAIKSELGNVGKAPAAPKPPKPRGPKPDATYKIALGDAYVKGPDTAKITIVEWSDFQCPYCKKVVPTLDQLQKDYGDEVRVAFKHNPLGNHPRAMPAALAAEAAGKQGKFWEMHDKLFENNRALSDDDLVGYAKELGLDEARFRKDMADPALRKKIEAQQNESNKLKVSSTPAFFVNGRYVRGAQPLANFKKLIDQELHKADKLLASGTAKKDLYAKLTEKGLSG